MTTPTLSSKRYRCAQCGHVAEQTTNHYGNTWSHGHYNCCSKCPPYAKYPEFGGATKWICLETKDVYMSGTHTLEELETQGWVEAAQAQLDQDDEPYTTQGIYNLANDMATEDELHNAKT